MKKLLWALAFIGAVGVTSFALAVFAVSNMAEPTRPEFDENQLGIWGFRALACGKGFQVVMASDPDAFAFDVKEGFLGHARTNGASDEDIEKLAEIFEDGGRAAIRSGFKEGVELDAKRAQMAEIIRNLVNEGCGVRTHHLIERGLIFIGQ